MPATNHQATAASPAAAHELDAPPWRRVESTLIRTAQGIRSAYDARLAHLDLNLSLASLLAYVALYGPISQSRAAEHLGQGRAVTGTQVDKLESMGLVERRPDPDDRRVWLVAATDAGVAMAKQVAEIDKVLRADLRDGIPREDRQALAKLLLRLHDNIERAQCAPNPESSPNPVETP